MARHKDVDVAVLPKNKKEVDIKKFEAGVDWWLPQIAQLEIKDVGIRRMSEVRWWENGNGVVVGAGLDLDPTTIDQLPFGLSIPSPAWLIKMQEAEVLARQARNVNISAEALEAFELSLQKGTNPKKMEIDGVVPLAVFAAYAFKLGLNNLNQERTFRLDLADMDLATIVAINSYKKTQK